jgi:hypothetical protein
MQGIPYGAGAVGLAIPRSRSPRLTIPTSRRRLPDRSTTGTLRTWYRVIWRTTEAIHEFDPHLAGVHDARTRSLDGPPFRSSRWRHAEEVALRIDDGHGIEVLTLKQRQQWFGVILGGPSKYQG